MPDPAPQTWKACWVQALAGSSTASSASLTRNYVPVSKTRSWRLLASSLTSRPRNESQLCGLNSAEGGLGELSARASRGAQLRQPQERALAWFWRRGNGEDLNGEWRLAHRLHVNTNENPPQV